MNGGDTAARELYRVVEVMALLSLSRSVLYEELQWPAPLGARRPNPAHPGLRDHRVRRAAGA